MNPKYNADFIEGDIYHIYNRTNNKELLFRSNQNRLFFLNQYAKYLNPFMDTFSWCLLPNHFHFLTRIKSAQEISSYLSDPSENLKKIEKEYLEHKTTADMLIECEWKRFFTSYSMAFNKEHSRTGNLFHRPFKRITVEKEDYFTQAVIYIHANPKHHNLCSDFTNYEWSSWKTLISDRPTRLKRDEVLDWFGGLEKFIETSKSLTEYYYQSEVFIED